MKKFFAILAIVALASCGGSSDSTPENDTAKKEEAAAPAETPAVDTVKIKTADGTKDSLYIIGTDTVKVAQ
jgi:hypothetical protein